MRSKERIHYEHHNKYRKYSSRSSSRNSRSRKKNHYKKHKDYNDKNKKHKSKSSKSSSRSYQSKSYSSSSSSNSSKEQGHYKFKTGEILGRKYKVIKLLGDGTFGRVVEAEYDNRIYAVKIIKAVPRYIESAKTEKSIIRYVNNKDPDDKEGIVRYVECFHHYNNYCIVFKPLGRSLYDLMKMNGYKGFPINLIQSFFKQILQSVGFLHSIGYTHTDLKPENVLLEDNRLRKQEYPLSQKNDKQYINLPENNKIRIIDFGGATSQSEHHSRIINTRQYRSPEVILGCCQWNEISDVWSIGCIIIELYTGDLYFSTHQNLEHLRMIEKHGGYFPEWMINRSSEYRRYFYRQKLDWPKIASSKESVQRVYQMKVVNEIFKNQAQIKDLLQKCLHIDPKKRITCEMALKHPFFEIQY